MEGNVITQFVLPPALFVVMLGMGLTLRVEDFRKVGGSSRALILGIACQMVALPLLTLALVSVLSLRPRLAAGLLILSFCPGGAVSNLVSFLVRANLALSIVLTAVVSLVTPLTLPVLTNLVLEHWLGEDAVVALPLGRSVVALVVLTIVPVVLGVVIHRRWPALARRAQGAVKAISLLVVLAVVASFVGVEWNSLPRWFSDVGPVCLTLNLAAMAMGYGVAALGRLPRAESTTIAIEVGIQNAVTALLITGTLLKDPQLSIVPLIYALTMLATSPLFMLLRDERKSTSSTP